MPYVPIYSASKAFTYFYSEALGAEIRNSKIQVLTACPMYVKTGMTKESKFAAGSGEITCEESVAYLLKALKSNKPLNQVFGPTSHTFSTILNHLLFSMFSYFRLPLLITEKFSLYTLSVKDNH